MSRRDRSAASVEGDGPRPGPTRASAVWTAVVVTAVVLIALIIFIAQNGHRVEVSFVNLHPRFPLGVALLVAAVGGSVVTMIAGTIRITQLRGVLRRHRRAHPDPRAGASTSEHAADAKPPGPIGTAGDEARSGVETTG